MKIVSIPAHFLFDGAISAMCNSTFFSITVETMISKHHYSLSMSEIIEIFQIPATCCLSGRENVATLNA